MESSPRKGAPGDHAAASSDVAFALQTLALRYASQRLHHLQLLGHVPSV